MNEMDVVTVLVKSISDSYENYEKAVKRKGSRPAFVGYDGLGKEDSKASIQRRITVVREQLLRISNSL